MGDVKVYTNHQNLFAMEGSAVLTTTPVCVGTSTWYRGEHSHYEWPIPTPGMRYLVCCEVQPMKWTIGDG